MGEKLTLRELIKRAIEATIKKDSLTQYEKDTIVEYILNNSILKVLDKGIVELNTFSEFGVGESNKNRLLPKVPRFLITMWFNSSPREELTNYWNISSYTSLDSLEATLRSRDYEGFGGEVGVLIDGKEQRYKVVKTPHPELEGVIECEIEWMDIKPYRLRYFNNKTAITEDYPSKYQVKSRILELIQDKNNEDYSVYNTIDSKYLGFTIQSEILRVEEDFDFVKNKTNTNLEFLWDNPLYLEDGEF